MMLQLTRFSTYDLEKLKSHGSFKSTNGRAGGIVPWLRTLTAFEEDSGTAPSTHMVAYNLLKLRFQGISLSLWLPMGPACGSYVHIQIHSDSGACVQTHTQHILTTLKKNES